MGDKIVPVLVGGVLIGILSALPIISAVNVCFCAWAIVGGGLAAFMYIKKSPDPVSAGGGFSTGALAGLIGSIIYTILFVPIGLLMGAPNSYREALRQAYGKRLYDPDLDGYILMGVACLLTFIFLIVMAGVGGLLGAKIFEKRGAGEVPPPPPAY
ncbi:MAG: hypothetical protein ABIP75_19215 [Pyrinomonadaceae bacterium]